MKKIKPEENIHIDKESEKNLLPFSRKKEIDHLLRNSQKYIFCTIGKNLTSSKCFRTSYGTVPVLCKVIIWSIIFVPYCKFFLSNGNGMVPYGTV